jgi:hypothetical protein
MSRSLWLWFLAGSILATGCYKPDEKFDEFAERDKELNRPIKEAGSLGDAPTSCPRTEGNRRTFLLTISPVIAPDKVSLVKMTITIAAGGNAMNIEAQTYANDRQTLVGEITPAGPVPINPDGTFQSDLVTLALLPEANCVIPGTALTTEVQLSGGFVCDDTNFACGDLTGRVIEANIDLTGSTWTAQEMPDGSPIPAPLKDCARTPIDPELGRCGS